MPGHVEIAPHVYLHAIESVLAGRTCRMLLEEFDQTRNAILLLKGTRVLLERNPVLARSIQLRNPYVDPLSLIQVELLRHKRRGESDDQLNYALASTMSGIAADCTIPDDGSDSGISSGYGRMPQQDAFGTPDRWVRID